MITFVYDCPHCFTESAAFEVGDFACREYDDLPINVFTILGVCNRCGHGIVASCGIENTPSKATGAYYNIGAKTVSQKVYERFLNHKGKRLQLESVLGFLPEFEPKRPEPNKLQYLPSRVEDKFRVAEKAFLRSSGDADFINIAGTAYRSAIELALAELDVDDRDKNLSWRINHLVKQHILVKSMGDFAHRIRILGNDATHNDISIEELVELRLFTSLFLQYTFTLPAMIPN